MNHSDFGVNQDFITLFQVLEQRGFKGLKIALIGDLGAGKTTFVRALAEKIDPYLTRQVASPTFALAHYYESKKLKIDHFDLYRLQSNDELEETGIFESMEDENKLILIEWADMFVEVLNQCNVVIEIKVEKEQRLFSVKIEG